MNRAILQQEDLRRAFRILLLILGWATCLAAITLAGIFNGVLLPKGLGGLLPQVLGSSVLAVWLIYLAVFAISFLTSLLIENPGLAFGSFFVSFCLAGAITYLVLTLPGILGAYGSTGVLAEASIRFTFIALFPFPLVAGLTGTILGLVVAEMCE